MSLLTPIRALRREPHSNSRSMCRCEISSRAASLTRAVSADTKSPRICTFLSHLKSPSFSRCAPLAAISFTLCRCKKGGAILCSQSKIRLLPLRASRHSSSACQRYLRPLPFELPSVQPLAHSSTKSRILPSVFSTTYTLNFFQVVCSQGFAHSRGGGGVDIASQSQMYGLVGALYLPPSPVA
jgi:hypothetical protein